MSDAPNQSSSSASDRLAVPLTTADHSIGNPEARATLLEYGDYECNDCFNAQPVIAELRKRVGDDLRVVFRHFPRSSIHPHASAAAVAAEAAGAQKRFWEMHEALFRHQQELGELDFTHLALRIGLEVYHFQSDLESAALLRRVKNDYDSGVQSGVTGTPTFFINGRRYRGKAELEPMLAEISRVLSTM